MLETNARVLSCERMAQELVRIVLHAPEIAAQAKAGQFIHMLSSGLQAQIICVPAPLGCIASVSVPA